MRKQRTQSKKSNDATPWRQAGMPEGHLGFHAEGQTAELKLSHLLTLQTYHPHSVVARQESVFLLTLENPAAQQ